METFGHLLRMHRQQRGLSLRDLENLTYFSYSHISQVERGVRSPTAKIAEECDRALRTGTILMDAYERETGEEAMRRRGLLQAMGVMAGTAAAPALDVEAVRHRLGEAAGISAEEWDEIVAGYGLDYYRLPAVELDQLLTADVDRLGRQIAFADGSERQRLLGAAAVLAVLMALGKASAGQSVWARRWWSTARRLAAESGDEGARLWVRGWDATSGCYDGRTVASLPSSVDALPRVQVASAAGCQVLGGYAQALSLAGRHDEAVMVVRQLADIAERLPATPDGSSLWGWSETRTEHTRSWVFTHAGMRREAEAAQDRAVALYPPQQVRLRAQVELHRAALMVGGGDVSGGLAYAGDVLDALPPEHHNRMVGFVTGRVVEAVPAVERARPAVRELVARAG